MAIPLTKVDVARRQLVTAITLFFNGGDSVSVLSLAANAWEVIDALCMRAGVASMSAQTRTYMAPGKDLKKDYINSPFRNFFKHADRDPDAVLQDLDDSVVEGILFLAVEDYIRMHGRSPIELQAFQLWYLACHTEKVAGDKLDEVLDAVAGMFPKIETLTRDEQIAMGRDALASALRNTDLLNDPRTEPAR
jgi:hypothetical protein